MGGAPFFWGSERETPSAFAAQACWVGMVGNAGSVSFDSVSRLGLIGLPFVVRQAGQRLLAESTTASRG